MLQVFFFLSLSSFFFFFLLLPFYSDDTSVILGHIAPPSPRPPRPWHTIRYSTRTVHTCLRREGGRKNSCFLLACRCHKQNLSWFGLASNKPLSQEVFLGLEGETIREREGELAIAKEKKKKEEIESL